MIIRWPSNSRPLNQISFTFTSETLTKPGATRGGVEAVETQGEISITFTNRSDISTGDFDVTYGYRNLSYFGVDEQSIHRAGFASGDGSWLGTYELLGSGQLGRLMMTICFSDWRAISFSHQPWASTDLKFARARC